MKLGNSSFDLGVKLYDVINGQDEKHVTFQESLQLPTSETIYHR